MAERSVDGPVPSFSAVVLAGGRSSRMGDDKAVIRIDGQSLAERAVRTLQEAGAHEILLAWRREQSSKFALGFAPTSGVRVVHDDGEGPLGGILLGMKESTLDLLVVLAVDLPLVRSSSIVALTRECEATSAGVVAAFAATVGRQPLFSVWNRRLVGDELESAWLSGQRSPSRWLAGRRDARWSPVDPEQLTNVNEPADLSRIGNLGSS